MSVSDRANWALQVAFSRDDIGHTDWYQAAAVLAGASALPYAQGIEGRALEQAMELAAERHERLSPRAPLAEVQGEKVASGSDLLGFTTQVLRHGGLATTYVGLAMRAAELAGRDFHEAERVRLTRLVRSVLAVKEIDRYLGAPREPFSDMPADLGQAQLALEAEAVGQLQHIQPDQVHKGMRVAFVGELIHGVIHASVVRQILRLAPKQAKNAVTRLSEQLSAQRKLTELRAAQQFDELYPAASLSFMDTLGGGFDDPEKLQLACAARELWEQHGRPPEWEPVLLNALAALE